jgi:hypothetical protein
MQQDHHYYASTVFGWAFGSTRDEAITRLIENFRTDLKQVTLNMHKKGEPGAYIWSCKVHVPNDENHPYDIEYYAPVGVKTSDGQEHAVTYVSKTEVAYTQTFKQEAEQRRRIMQDPKAMLEHVDSLLADMVSDKMNEAEDRGEKSRGHDFVVAEDAAPDLDTARTYVEEALLCLKTED